MKILFLNGSARKNGNTNYLLNIIHNRLDKKLFESEIINISEHNINYCLGCGSCKKDSKCIQSDDFNIIFKKLEKTDIICISSPSYWGYLTAQLKTFIDRTRPYCNAAEGTTIFPKGKYGISIAIRKGSSDNETLEVIKAIEHYFSHLVIDSLFSFHIERINSKNDYNNSKIITNIDSFCNKINVWGRDIIKHGKSLTMDSTNK